MAVYAGGYRILEGKLTPGRVLFPLWAAMGLLYEPAKRLNRLNLPARPGSQGRGGTDLSDSGTSRPEIQEKKERGYDRTHPARILFFQDVSFRYEEEEVLSGINLEIKKGEIIALVGEKRRRQNDARPPDPALFRRKQGGDPPRRYGHSGTPRSSRSGGRSPL